MRHGPKATILVLTGVLISTGANAVAPDSSASRYQGIVDRNVFNLHPPELKPEEQGNQKQTQIPKLTLNGITTILGKKIAFITVPATKPGTQPQTLMLAEGQAQDEVEVRQIDEKAGMVKVVNHSEDQSLDFEHDGTKPAGPVGNPATPMTAPTAPPTNVLPIPRPQPGVNAIRPLRSLQSRSSPYSSNGGSPFAAGLPGGATSPSAAQNQTPMTPEQQMLMIEAQRMKYRQDGNPAANIFPPTTVTPGNGGGDTAPQ